MVILYYEYFCCLFGRSNSLLITLIITTFICSSIWQNKTRNLIRFAFWYRYAIDLTEPSCDEEELSALRSASNFCSYMLTYLLAADASFVSGLLTSSTVVKTENASNDVTKNWASSTTVPAAAAEDKGRRCSFLECNAAIVLVEKRGRILHFSSL